MVQGWQTRGFGAFIYGFLETEIDDYGGDASVGRHAFYVYNPTTSADVVFKQMVRDRPLPASFGGLSSDIEAVFFLMWSNRQTLRRQNTSELYPVKQLSAKTPSLPGQTLLVNSRPLPFRNLPLISSYFAVSPMARLCDAIDSSLIELSNLIQLKPRVPLMTMSPQESPQAPLWVQNGEPRQQMSLENIRNNTESLSPSFAAPRTAGRLDGIEAEDGKPLPSRKAKTAARRRTIQVIENMQMEDSSSEQKDSDDTFDPDSASDDSVSDVDSRVKPEPRTRKPPQRRNPRLWLNASPKENVALEARKAFASSKTQIANALFTKFDDKITNGKLAERTGGVKIVWTKRLNTTAGRAIYYRERIKTMAQDGKRNKEYKYHASIEFSVKLVNNQERLNETCAHEFCHLADLMISGGKGRPHGKEFKDWATRVMEVFGVEVTTTHNYEVEYRFAWECVACGKEYKRHSKSVDVERDRCGRCNGRLIQTRPAVKRMSGYQIFVKQSFGSIMAENPGMEPKEVMRLVGERYRKQRASSSAVGGAMTEELDSLTQGMEGISLDSRVREGVANFH